MDECVFTVSIYRDDDMREPPAQLDLPATYFELEDALQRAHIQDESEACVELTASSRFMFLWRFLPYDVGLYEMNALAEKLAELESWQADAFEGSVRIDGQNKVEIDLPRLLNVASSVDACQVIYEAESYESLGKFYAENILPDFQGLPDEMWELLDFHEIGKRVATQENGAFLDGGRGYVVRIEDIQESAKDIDLTPKKPDYTALLEVTDPDTGESTMLKLPCERADLDSILTKLDVPGWSGLVWRCADCRVPSLRDAFSTTDNILFANVAARRLAELPEGDVMPFKALLEAHQIAELTDAAELMGGMDVYAENYTFEPNIRSPTNEARQYVKLIVSELEAPLLCEHLDLDGYGRELMERFNSVLTPYGLVTRRDLQPIEALEPQQETRTMEMGGMSMM